MEENRYQFHGAVRDPINQADDIDLCVVRCRFHRNVCNMLCSLAPSRSLPGAVGRSHVRHATAIRSISFSVLMER
uniref:Uncharacterized protein n=1 Tax=Anguilla anguilla TaxID=7936 RepID=A0A0E9Q3F6_ANGAN